MADRQMLYCANHPDRIALERCEVCAKPLCAYCLYYTEDGQRLCREHAIEARARGLTVEEPGVYADQLLGAQVGAHTKRKRSLTSDDSDLYKGNSTDLMSFVGLLIGVMSLGACCGAFYCLPVAGGLLSLAAVINAKNAHDPGRTRKMGWIGLLVSGVWVAAIVFCVGAFMFPAFLTSSATSTGSGPYFFPTLSTSVFIPYDTPTPLPTPTWTPEATRRSLDDSAAGLEPDSAAPVGAPRLRPVADAPLVQPHPLPLPR